MTTLEKLNMNVNQANSDFQAIKDKILEKGVTIADRTRTAEYGSKIDEVYEKGIADAPNLLEYATNISSLYYGARFPTNSNITLITPNATSLNYLFYNALGLTKITLAGFDGGRTLDCQNTFRDATNLITIDLTNFKIKPSNAFQMFHRCSALREINGELDFSECSNTNNVFTYCNALQEVRLKENTLQLSTTFQYSTKLSHTSLYGIVKGLSDTASDQSLTLSQEAVGKAFETNPGLNDGMDSTEWNNLIAEKSNWTFNYK